MSIAHLPRTTLPRFVLSVLLLLAATFVSAQDMPGSRDHPAVKRFAGSTIIAYDTKRFDSYTLQTGPYKRYNTSTSRPEYAASEALEGAVTTIWYESAGATTSTELLRNYVNELQGQGFSLLYDSTKDGSIQAGNGFLQRFGDAPPKTNRTKYVFSAATNSTARFASMKKSRPEGDLFVGVTTVEWSAPDNTFKTQRGAYAAVDVVEIAPMKQQMVTVSAGEMARSMSETGRVALYGIYFDTAKADLKPESKPALDEIAKLMKSEANLKLRVVGHTDNQGTLDANIALSKRRAEAVNAALAGQYGVAAARLAAFGVADLAPVATNGNEAGRAKNRRVELVPQ